MSPNYLNGDKVICSHLPKIYLGQAIRDYIWFMVVTEHFTSAKRLVNKIRQGCIELISDNPLFDPKQNTSYRKFSKYGRLRA